MSSGEFWGAVAAIAAVATVLYGFLRNSMRDLRTDVISALDAKFTGVDAKFNAMNDKFDALAAKMDERFTREREYNDIRFDAIEHRLDGLELDMTIIKGALIGKISA